VLRALGSSAPWKHADLWGKLTQTILEAQARQLWCPGAELNHRHTDFQFDRNRFEKSILIGLRVGKWRTSDPWFNWLMENPKKPGGLPWIWSKLCAATTSRLRRRCIITRQI
jgi:hypothetical protein